MGPGACGTAVRGVQWPRRPIATLEYNDPVKFKVLLGSLVWLVLITTAHVQFNVGWARLLSQFRVTLGMERPELIVGFLPVT